MSLRDEATAEAKRIEEDAFYSSNGHFYAASGWGFAHNSLGVVAAMLAAIAASTASQGEAALTSSISIVAAVSAGLLTFLKPGDQASAHLRAGNSYSALKNRTRIYYAIESQAKTDLESADRVLELSHERDRLNASSPQLPSWAYWLAKRKIEAGAHVYEVDKPSC